MGTTVQHLDDLLTTREAAALLGISTSLVNILQGEKLLVPVGRGGKNGLSWLYRRGDLIDYHAKRRDRMTTHEACVALGLGREGVKGLVATGQLHRFPPLPYRKGETFARSEVETLAANRARRLSGHKALERAGMNNLPAFRHWLAKTGGTVHWHGGVAVFEPDDLDRIRKALSPDGLDVNETADLLGVSTWQVRRLVRQGKLQALTTHRGMVGWRFDPEVVHAYKQARDSSVLLRKQEKERTALRSVLDRWSTTVGSGSTAVGTSTGRTVHHAHYARDLHDDAKALPSAWQAW